jgi:histidinol phosphatase-like PHP family hydrolase
MVFDLKRNPKETISVKALEALYVHNIDLHYHAGQERQPGTTLEGYLEHAVMTGRVVLGVTDHLEKYIGCPLSPTKGAPLYEQSVAGLQAYRADVDRLRHRFPTLQIYFGPEIHAGPRIDLRRIPQGVVDVSDYFLVSLPAVDTSIAANTEARIDQVRLIAEMRERTGRPTFIAHPFRAAVNVRLVKRPIEPWIISLVPRPPDAFVDDEVNRFFGFDVRALGRVCSEYDVPVEINGGTDSRIRGLNLPAPLQMFWAAYRILQQEVVTFVPGSDQHGYMRNPTRREGRYVPFDAFAALGVRARDILFVKQLLDGRDSGQE